MPTIAPGCDLEVERGPDWLLVRPRNVDATIAEDFFLAERVWRLLQQHFTYRLVLELDEMEVLSSDLVDQLLELSRRIERHDGVLRICGLSPHNIAVLRDSCLAERLSPYENREAAIMGRQHPEKPR
jgi:hypothetical protein